MPPSLHRSPTLPLASDFLATPSTRLSPALIRALLPFDLLIVPGLFGSDEDHWQSIWENVFRAHGLSVKRVAQDNWSTPSLSAWQAKLDETLKEAKRPVLLLAHSLGAVLTVHHGARHPASAVAGALLVAPADGEQHKGPDAARIESFMPLPAQTLPFPSTVIFSRNDPWLTPDRAQTFCTQWGSTLVNGGYSGHMGNNAGLEHWPLGLNALHSLALTCHAGQVHAHA